MSEETTSSVPHSPAPEEANGHREVPADTGFTVGPIPSSRSNSRFSMVLLSLVTLAAAGYSFHERSLAKQLSANNSALATSLNATRDQLSALTAKVSALETKPSPTPATKTAATIYRKPLTPAVARHRIDDPRWKHMQGQLDEQGRQIASTREDMASTRTELQGSIAKTHNELVVLQKKGERNYYEFDVSKSGELQRQGPISIRLKKANTKHEYADLELMVDDFKVSKKHVNIDEPVVFYPGDERTPVELVINNIGKNRIRGYVSEPKYRGADLQAMTNSGANSQSVSGDQVSSDGKPSPARQKLQLPSNEPVR